MSSLDQFDLGAASGEFNGQDRASEISDFGSEFGSEFNTGRDSWRLSQVLDLGVLDGVDMSGTRNYRDRSSTLSELQNISEEGGVAEVTEPRNRRQSHQPLDEGEEFLSEDENVEEEGELCGGCGLVLEGEAVEALNQYFHYEVRYPILCFLDKWISVICNAMIRSASTVAIVTALSPKMTDMQRKTAW